MTQMQQIITDKISVNQFNPRHQRSINNTYEKIKSNNRCRYTPRNYQTF
jgi:hypothetical protein